MHYCRLIVIIIFSVLSLSSQCQTGSVTSFKRCAEKTINFEQGLINNSIASVITDAIGLTWVSTITGLQRFNGVALEKITPIIDDDTILINYPVFFLAAQNGSLLIGYKRGILEYVPSTNSFIKKLSIPPLTNLHYSLVPVKETAEGIWCFQENRGLLIYNHQQASAALLSSNEIVNVDNIFFSGALSFSIVIASNCNFIFMRSEKNAVLQIDIYSHKLKYIQDNHRQILGISCNEKNLFITSSDGLTSININDGSVSGNYRFEKMTTEHIENSVIFKTKNSQLLVSAEKHLYEFDSLCNFQKELTRLDNETFVATGRIAGIYEDTFNRIWLMTNDDMKRIQDAEISFEHFFYSKEKNNFVRAVYYDRDKNILLAGCYNGGLQLYDSLGNPLWASSLISDDVKDVLFIEKLAEDRLSGHHSWERLVHSPAFYKKNYESRFICFPK